MSRFRRLRHPGVAAGAALILVVVAGLAGGARPTQSSAARTTSVSAAVAAPGSGLAADLEVDRSANVTSEGETGRLPLSRTLVILGLIGAIVLFIRGGFPVPPDDSVPDPLVPPDPVHSGGAGPLNQETLVQEALATMQGALAVLRDERDPARAVRRAYAELAEGFGQTALRRQPAESESEYLARVLATFAGSGSAALGGSSLTALLEQEALKVSVDPKYPQAIGISVMCNAH